MLFEWRSRQGLPAATYLELVRSLLDTLVPTVIMTFVFVIVAATCSRHVDQPLLTAMAFGGSGSGVVRLAVLIRLRAVVGKRGLDVDRARRLERVFAAPYLAFSLSLGLFAFAAMTGSSPEDQTAVTAMVVGYGAGVAAALSLRPRIAVPAILLAVMPAVAGSLMAGDTGHRMLAFILALLLVGGVVSVLKRYREAVDKIAMGQRFASLARSDPLTGLANRLALEDGFLRAVAASGGRDVALHCFDLDHFKPVNDTHGHFVGDLLLQAVASRLERLLRAGDLAVRMGGDEFAVMQTGVGHPDEAELMARRIARAIGEPYRIAGREIHIAASVGSASGWDHGPDLARLLSFADDALYEVKRASRPQIAQAS